MNRRNMNTNQNGLGKENLEKRIKALCFAKTEAELFLDTHPTSRVALTFYHDIVTELERLVEEYSDKYGPITAAQSSSESWNWIDGPWPWQRETDENKKGGM